MRLRSPTLLGRPRSCWHSSRAWRCRSSLPSKLRSCSRNHPMLAAPKCRQRCKSRARKWWRRHNLPLLDRNKAPRPTSSTLLQLQWKAGTGVPTQGESQSQRAAADLLAGTPRCCPPARTSTRSRKWQRKNDGAKTRHAPARVQTALQGGIKRAEGCARRRLAMQPHESL